MTRTRTPYTAAWRDRVRAGARSSAEALGPVLIELFNPLTAVDVGCGEGWLARQLEDQGVDALGVDGPWVEGVTHVELDAPPYPPLGRFDLAVSLEVAEHVHGAHADELVAWLVELAPTVVFSAAIPGQGGVGHVNEQWPAYWAERFAACGYAGSGALRARLWDDERIEPWYRQNLLVFGELHGLEPDGCPAIVHPGIWSVYR